MLDGKFGLNGYVGFIIAVLIVVIGAIIVGWGAIYVQRKNATDYYTINTSSLQMKSVDNKNAITYHKVKE
ncbi:hypothetical protein BKH43_04195 [Helicobacter sp. 13S00401-1]|uniref:DUF4006 family protein n=1 Tax=Helicobacter sp. 13S00401-1 TaxID=1905758 RepID=UPI000BC9AE61|nr:DUF4006 family protein [Helicobacter sp. 13S00401-1]PAF50764.1 hypothetical protein BKH43_04195 [Helicobacter sp. 13S00401-1]